MKDPNGSAESLTGLHQRASPTVAVMFSAALAGFLTMMSLIVAIGAQNAFVLRQGIRREHVLPVVVLCSAADALLIAAGIAGLGAIIANHPAVLTVTKYVGAAFLLVLAFGSFRRARHPEVLDPAATGPASLSAVLTTCLALTFLNPNVYLDTVVLIGSLAHQHEPDAWVFGLGAVAGEHRVVHGARIRRRLPAAAVRATAVVAGARHRHRPHRDDDRRSARALTLSSPVDRGPGCSRWRRGASDAPRPATGGAVLAGLRCPDDVVPLVVTVDPVPPRPRRGQRDRRGAEPRCRRA